MAESFFVGQVENLRADWQSALLSWRELSVAAPLLFVPNFHYRRLPHLHAIDRPAFLTWRLYGSLPLNRSFSSNITSGRAFVAMARILDQARSGPLYLRRADIAQLLVDAMRYRDEQLRQFEMHSWVVMANHVHVLITPHIEVSKLMHSLKRFTAREANKILGLTGQPFWQDESYDRLVRDETEFQRIARYTEMNPVKA